MTKIFHELTAEKSKELLPGFTGVFIHSERMTHAYWTVKAGAELPSHSHDHEQVATVLEGEFEITIDGETKKVTVGDVAVIGSGLTHSGKAITDCRILDVFSPVREDYR